MIASEGVGLEWVVVDDRRSHVSEFAHLRPGRRPPVACPECGATVILALGKIKRHHARHRPQSKCLATNPETALHLNVKYYIASVIEGAAGMAAALRLRRRCLVGNRPYRTGGEASWVESTAASCAAIDDSVWIERWDAVRVESRVANADGHRVPDIVLYEGGKAIGAIEVVVSHEVDPDKAAMLARLDVGWIEVTASETLYAGPTAWTIDQPLEPARGSMSLDWRCELHRIVAVAEQARVMAVAERPPQRSPLLGGRVVDLYLPDGKWRRLVYRVRGIFGDADRLERIALDRNGQLVESYLSSKDETESAFRARTRTLVDRDCDADVRSHVRRGAVVDVGRWLKDDALGLLDEDVSRLERGFRYDRDRKQWIRIAVTPPLDAARQRIESAMRGRRSIVQQSLVPARGPSAVSGEPTPVAHVRKPSL